MSVSVGEMVRVDCSTRVDWATHRTTIRAAELLNSIHDGDDGSDTEIDSPMSDTQTDIPVPPVATSRGDSPRETRLEQGEKYKFLLAKTYFDCREYDRCAAVFLPMVLPKGQITETKDSPNTKKKTSTAKSAGKDGPLTDDTSIARGYPSISQKALFLALYAKYMSGEKRKDEDSEMILGPADNGSNLNKELVIISRVLQARFRLQEERGEAGSGWLEYLYGIVLIKGKDDQEARKWLLKSVALYPFNWGAWQELGSLVSSTDEVILLNNRLMLF